MRKNIELKNEPEKAWSVPLGIVCMLLGSFAVYSILFSTGYFIYGEINNGITFLVIGLSFAIFLKHNWNKLKKLK